MGHYRYPRFVDKQSIATIFDGETERRYLIRLKLKKRGSERLLVIIDSVGTADELDCDGKLQRILRYIKESRELLEVGEIILVSLFPICSCKAMHVMDKLYEMGPDYVLGIDKPFLYNNKLLDNYQLIKELITEVDIIILAWGSATGPLKKYHLKGSEEIVAFIKYDYGRVDNVYSVGDKLLKGFPKSPLCWSFTDSLRAYFQDI